MNDLEDLFQKLNRRTTYGEIADRVGISRTTLLKFRNEPDKSSIRVLRRIAQVLGYEIVLTFQKIVENGQGNEE